jgi:hypothetical protein
MQTGTARQPIQRKTVTHVFGIKCHLCLRKDNIAGNDDRKRHKRYASCLLQADCLFGFLLPSGGRLDGEEEADERRLAVGTSAVKHALEMGADGIDADDELRRRLR